MCCTRQAPNLGLEVWSGAGSGRVGSTGAKFELPSLACNHDQIRPSHHRSRSSREAEHQRRCSAMLCKQCGSDAVEYDNSQAVCQNCGLVVAESQIVSDITFAETAAGGAAVQGSYLGQDQTHVRVSNTRFRSSGAGDSREQTMHRAREAIERTARANRITTTVRDRALRWFSLALSGGTANPRQDDGQPKNFVLGRKQEYTVASCLYVACRMERTTHMLIDFADAMNINVFVLGRHYLKLVRALNLRLPVLDPSIYIIRFAALLHFGDETNRVAQDAVRLCNRFKKDWLSDGRRPAGICGAALLLAARMNNFRRSMNEIVQVVKMADVTIRNRLAEFKRTPSAQLSLSDFQSVWLEEEYEPPSFYRPAMEEENKKRKEEKRRLKEEKKAAAREKKRAKLEAAGGEVEDKSIDSDDANDADEEEDDEGQQQGAEPAEGAQSAHTEQDDELPAHLNSLADEATRQQIEAYTNDPEFQTLDDEAARRNLESQQRARQGGMAIMGVSDAPAIDPELLKESSTQAEKEQEAVLRQEPRPDSSATVAPEQNVPPTEPEGSSGTVPEAFPADVLTKKDASQTRASVPPATTHVEDTLEDLDEDELDQFILGPEEVKIKERVWMEFNHDYLQEALKRQLKEEADEKAGIRRRPPRSRKAPPKPRDSSTAQGASAADSARQMMQKKTKTVSKKLNYDVMSGIDGLFGGMDGATGYGQSGPSRSNRHKRKRHHDQGRSSRKPTGYDSTTDGDTTDAEVRQARAAKYFGDDNGLDLEVVDEAGDALPSTHPLQRVQSRAERENKRRKERMEQSKRAGISSATSGGEESATDLGTQHGRSGVSGGEDDEEEDDMGLNTDGGEQYPYSMYANEADEEGLYGDAGYD
ncbi:unnamed protein product [Parajaminaea phylloscopi]